MLPFVNILYLACLLHLLDNLRKQAWPKLVGLNCTYEAENRKHSESPRGRPGLPRPSARDLPSRMPAMSQNNDGLALVSIPPKKRTVMTVPVSDDAEQIDRDVARCTWHLLIGSQRSRRLQMKNKHRKKMGVLIKRKQKRLGNLINLTLLQTYGEDGTDRLKYYQGYHDIASIFLSALGGGAVPLSTDAIDPESPHAIAVSIGLDLPARVLAQVSRSHFRDPMRANFQELQTALKLTIFPLMSAFDPEVHNHLWECDMSPFFCLSWILTWFSHDIRDTALVTRLFDAFLVSHPLFSIYMAVAMVCHPLNRAEILNTECDFSELHQVLAALPKNSSMVGWKYRPGDGYVSGDDDGEDATVSTGMDLSFFDEDPVEGRDDDETDTQSMISHMGILGKESRVPFQELIDIAISYMRRIPPRKILALARRYYDNETLIPMMANTKLISLLQPPPRWALLATLPADWVLKQRMLELGSRSTTRRARRIRSRSRTRSRSDDKTDSEPSLEKEKIDVSIEKAIDGKVLRNSDKEDEIETYLKEQAKSLAVIACGFGPCEEDERQRRLKARKFLIWSGFAIAIVAISVTVMMKYGMSTKSESKQFQRDMFDNIIRRPFMGLMGLLKKIFDMIVTICLLTSIVCIYFERMKASPSS
jgi:TBC1 domain family member 20